MAALTHPRTRPTTPTTFHHPAIHPDWLPAADAPRDGMLAAHTTHPHDQAPASRIGLPAGLQPADRAPTTAPARADQPAYARAWFPGSAFPPPDEDHPEDEDAIFHDPFLPGGRETQLSHTALPLRHRIYALHCQGRTISTIARTLRLDRGTVARHLHAVEDLLLAEQTEDLARLRLRAVEAQHAILAAAWDALLFEELQEHSYERERENDRGDYTSRIPQPARSRRAQLLATAARAARTAAQLQGLFTPAALQAALRDRLPADAAPAPAATVSPPRAGEESDEISAASCGMPASAPHASASCMALPAGLQPTQGSATTPPIPAGLPVECNSTARPTTTPPAIAERRSPASASPPRAGEWAWGERSTTHRPFVAAATAAVRHAMLQ